MLWPWWLKDVQPFHNTDLAKRADVWRATFWPYLGLAARGPSFQENHSSVQKDPALIGRIVAKYLLGRVVEQIPVGRQPPSVVHPLGLVDKKSVEEPFRIIHNCREDNQTIVRWPSRLHGMAASAFLFSPLALKAAYLTVSLRCCCSSLRPTGARLQDCSSEFIVECLIKDGSCEM